MFKLVWYPKEVTQKLSLGKGVRTMSEATQTTQISRELGYTLMSTDGKDVNLQKWA